jgi:hypothetical protein
VELRGFLMKWESALLPALGRERWVANGERQEPKAELEMYILRVCLGVHVFRVGHRALKAAL